MTQQELSLSFQEILLIYTKQQSKAGICNAIWKYISRKKSTYTNLELEPSFKLYFNFLKLNFKTKDARIYWFPLEDEKSRIELLKQASQLALTETGKAYLSNLPQWTHSASPAQNEPSSKAASSWPSASCYGSSP